MTSQPGLEKFYRSFGAERGVIIGIFDKDSNGQVDDLRLFAEHFTKTVPPHFTGVVALDWEGTILEWVSKPPESDNFQRAVSNLAQLLITAKRLRPKAQIGYYGLPLREYWERNESWRERSLALTYVLRHADWVGPSIYHLYKTGEQQPAESVHRYAVEIVNLALEVAKLAGDKPVYPFIHHRYHPNARQFAMKLVTDDEFRANLDAILEAEHGGKGIDGVIWWGADSYFLRTGKLQTGGDARESLERIHKHYCRMIADILRNSPRSASDPTKTPQATREK